MNYVQRIVPYSLLFLVHATKLEDCFPSVKIVFKQKRLPEVFSTMPALPAGVEHPEAMEMIKEALKRNGSKQPRPNWESDGNWWIFRVVRNLSAKNPWG